MNRFLIGIDDTDTPQTGGTGRLARMLAEELARWVEIKGVTRHQLAVLPGIPYTRNNSANVVHLRCSSREFTAIVEHAVVWVANRCCHGSEPGLCAGDCRQLQEIGLGRAAQRRVVAAAEAQQAAASAGIVLQAVRDGARGIVGALAGAALASSGNDGRFVQVGAVRELRGMVTPVEVINAGVDEIRTVSGEAVPDGRILVGNGLRPALCEGLVVLFVEPGHDGWLPVKGWPHKIVPEPVTTGRQEIP